MPAIKLNTIPMMESVINLSKNRYVMMAPKNSDSPDKNVYPIAFKRLFVAK